MCYKGIMVLLEKFSKKTIVWAGIFLFLVGGIAYFYFNAPRSSPYQFDFVKRGDIIQEVDVTGRVKPADEVDLAFEAAGRVVSIAKEVGERVQQGDELARLDASGLYFELKEAQANLKAEQERLKNLENGSRPEEINAQRAKVAKALAVLDESKKDAVNKMQEAYTTADDAVRNKVDQFFNSPRGRYPKLVFSLNDAVFQREIEEERFFIEGILNEWSESIKGLEPSEELESNLSVTKERLTKIKDFLDKAAEAVNSLEASASFSQTKIDSWRSDVSTARSSINSAIDDIVSAQKQLSVAASDYEVEKSQLALKESGPTQEEISAQRALVEAAKARIDALKDKIAKTVLVSPISGIVSRADIEVGETVSANQKVFSLISDKKLKVEANVSEIDIADLEVGQKAQITLDAFGDSRVFEAKIISIDPAEKMIEGVPTYKTTFEFLKEDKEIRPGMTANISIVTAKKNRVLIVPARAVLSRDGKKIVRLYSRGKIEEREVETGLEGSFGDVEIVKGLKEGEKIVVFVREK